MEQEKIYLVITPYGTHGNYKQKIECAFRDKDEAENYALDLDNEHFSTPIFPDDLWNDICLDVDNYYELHEDECTNPYVGGTDEWEEWEKKFKAEEKELYLAVANKHLEVVVTLDAIEMQLKAIKNKFFNYQVAKVIEITLCK
jgi:hypothetical protein